MDAHELARIRALWAALDAAEYSSEYEAALKALAVEVPALLAAIERLQAIESAAREVVAHIRNQRVNKQGERVIYVLIGGTEFGYTDSADPEYPGYPLLRDMLKLHDELAAVEKGANDGDAG